MSDNKSAGSAHPLRLIALDGQDLDVISAHLQDALVRRGDLHYLQAEHRFVLALHRHDWEGEQGSNSQRRLTAMHFEHVRTVRHRNLGETQDALHTLLAVYFIENESPSGTVVIEFKDGAAIRLDVECLEAQMKDLGPTWEEETKPTDLQVEKDNADDT